VSRRNYDPIVFRKRLSPFSEAVIGGFDSMAYRAAPGLQASRLFTYQLDLLANPTGSPPVSAAAVPSWGGHKFALKRHVDAYDYPGGYAQRFDPPLPHPPSDPLPRSGPALVLMNGWMEAEALAALASAGGQPVLLRVPDNPARGWVVFAARVDPHATRSSDGGYLLTQVQHSARAIGIEKVEFTYERINRVSW
jgi:hypothetical protein